MSTTAQIRDLKPAFTVKAESYRSQAREAREQAAEHRKIHDRAPSGFGASAALERSKKALERAANLEKLAVFADASARAAGQGIFLTTLDRDLAVVQTGDPRISAARAAAYDARVVVKYDPADARWHPEGYEYKAAPRVPDTLADYRAHKGLPSDPMADPDVNPSLAGSDPSAPTPSVENRPIVPIGGW